MKDLNKLFNKNNVYKHKPVKIGQVNSNSSDNKSQMAKNTSQLKEATVYEFKTKISGLEGQNLPINRPITIEEDIAI